MPWLFPILAYLVGSIPFGLLLGKAIKGIDIRDHGSGNIGATNVLRIVGKKWGILCLFLDFLKGFLPVVLATNLVRAGAESAAVPLPFLAGLTEPLAADQQFMVHCLHVATALASILGHNYSVFLRFHGGKGIATSAGVLVALMPLVLACMLVVFCLSLALTRWVSLGSILAALSLPVFAHLEARFRHLDGRIFDAAPGSPTLWSSGTWNKPLFAFACLACVLALWRHRGNIQRLLRGTEPRIGRSTSPATHDS